jgi:hypothetical protein
MRNAIFCLVSVAVAACGPDLSKPVWTPKVLTVAEHKRQEELLKDLMTEIISKDVLGKPASDYEEFLSLADGMSVRGDESTYVYKVMSVGDVRAPHYMTIVVSGGKIVKATWPIAAS